MNIIGSIETIFRKYVPSPFTIAILLTITTIFLALIFTVPEEISSVDYLIDILTFWEKGIWSTSLLEFAYQMMLILVLGHVLVLSKPVSNLILKITFYCKKHCYKCGYCGLFNNVSGFF